MTCFDDMGVLRRVAFGWVTEHPSMQFSKHHARKRLYKLKRLYRWIYHPTTRTGNVSSVRFYPPGENPAWCEEP